MLKKKSTLISCISNCKPILEIGVEPVEKKIVNFKKKKKYISLVQ
jgi:hypothetical protein